MEWRRRPGGGFMLLTGGMLLVALALLALAGCGDEGVVITSPMSPQVSDDFIAGAPAQNLIRPRVHVYYFGAKTGEDYQDVVRRIEERVRWAQFFYLSEMNRHGYPGKTFLTQRHPNGALVRQIIPRHDTEYYLAHSGLSQELFDRLDGRVSSGGWSRKPRLFFTDIPSDYIDACGVAGAGATDGRATIFGGLCWDGRTVAHELGHVFQLPHDFRNGEYIMSYGKTIHSDGTVETLPLVKRGCFINRCRKSGDGVS